MFQRLLLVTLSSLALAMPFRSNATDVEWASTREIAELATRGAVVECLSVETRPVEKFGGNLFTFSRFRVLEEVFGELDAEFTLRLYGGQLGEVAIDAPMVPRFKAGERVILFLGPDNKDGHPTAFIQGVYQITQESDFEDALVLSPITALELHRASDDAPYQAIPDRVPVPDFVHSLKRLAR